MKLPKIALLSLLLSACAGMPKEVKPVANFELDRYQGQWYEIARFNHRFERNLEQVTAVYTINDDGTVRVENRGFSTKANEWKDATGKARFVGESDQGFLEVSFFGPFYGPYLIFELDEQNYQYAFVTGGEKYLWFLARTPTVSEELKQTFITTIRELGYNPDELIFVQQ